VTAYRRAPTIGLNLWPQDGTWAELREAALTADRVGIDSLWTWDHLYAIAGEPDRPIFEGWTTIAAWAALTERIELGLLVAANTFRNPGLTAKAALTVDHISGGRAWLGLGGAWFETEHTAHGLDFGSGFGERLDRLDEALAAITALFRGDSVASPEGGHYAFRDLVARPLPVRGPGTIPILVGGSGEKKTLRTVARYANAWHAFGDVERFKRKIGILEGHCADVGRDIAEITFSCGPYLIIRDEPRDALAVLNAALAKYDDSAEDGEETWVGPPERIAERWRPFAEIGVTLTIPDLPSPCDRETIERWPEVRALLSGA
jgi:alkanesulfonate monooxygenase SsuD/methylene tetrahydromethanopterin reductase-like flavin-dependent oxidoreductase (luciferase family)